MRIRFFNAAVGPALAFLLSATATGAQPPAAGAALASATVEQPNVRATLLATRAGIVPGESTWLVLRLVSDPGWHTYWKQAGDAGGPTNIAWTVPPGFAVDTTAWPLPIRFQLADVVSYGYEGEVLLPVRITAPADLTPGADVTIRATADWIVCEQICIPGRGDFALRLPVTADAPPATPLATAIEVQLAEGSPRPLPPAAEVTVDTTAGGYRVVVRGLPALADAEFWPAMAFHFLHGAPQAPSTQNGAITLTLTRAPSTPAAPRLSGMVVGTLADGSRAGWEFSAPVRGARQPAVAEAPPTAAVTYATGDGDTAAASTLTLVPALLLAFLGGLVLNLMPCVLPVIALKVFSFAELGGRDHGKARLHGFAFAFGVIATFLVLAGALLALRAGGAELGWGFQLQSPAFVAGIAVLLFVLSLSLLGVVEIGAEFTRLGAASFEGGYGGSVANGVLATVVATPCTAPMMGAAIAYGLQASPPVALSIFAALGAGMAAPYVVLAAWPAALRLLPKPGMWMVTLKKLMALPMFATVAWLAWVYAQQVGGAGLGPFAVALLAGGIGAWLLGHASLVSATSTTRLLRRGAGAAFLVLSGFVAWGSAAARPPAQTAEPFTDDYGLTWEPWSEAAVAKHRAAGRPVFVDFTAAWCLSCKVNERVAFSSRDVRDRLAQLDVALLRADWTARDETIARAVEGFGRRGIPLYVLYPADRSRAFVLLPEVLTPGIVTRALEQHARGVAAR